MVRYLKCGSQWCLLIHCEMYFLMPHCIGVSWAHHLDPLQEKVQACNSKEGNPGTAISQEESVCLFSLWRAWLFLLLLGNIQFAWHFPVISSSISEASSFPTLYNPLKVGLKNVLSAKTLFWANHWNQSAWLHQMCYCSSMLLPSLFLVFLAVALDQKLLVYGKRKLRGI